MALLAHELLTPRLGLAMEIHDRLLEPDPRQEGEIGRSWAQAGLDFEKSFLAIKRLKLAIAIGLKAISGFSQPNLVQGSLFRRIEAPPEPVNDLSSLPRREFKRFVGENHAVHEAEFSGLNYQTQDGYVSALFRGRAIQAGAPERKAQKGAGGV